MVAVGDRLGWIVGSRSEVEGCQVQRRELEHYLEGRGVAGITGRDWCDVDPVGVQIDRARVRRPSGCAELTQSGFETRFSGRVRSNWRG
jgi:hypothetical protein